MGWPGHVAHRLWWGNLSAYDHLEDTNVDGRITLQQIFKKSDRGIGWTDLAEDEDRWRDFVKAIINLRDLNICWEFLD